MNKKEARSILGVSKEASKNEIERKYAILLKKYRQGVYLNRQEEQDHPDEGTDIHDTGPADNESAAGYNAADPGYDFDLVTEAYNTLMGYEVKVEEEAPGMLASFLKKFNLDEKSLLISLIIISITSGRIPQLFIAIIISSFVNRRTMILALRF